MCVVKQLALFKEEIDNLICSPNFLSLIDGTGHSNEILSYLKEFQIFSSKGKRIRPFLVKMGFELCNNSYDPRILLPAVSYEVFQSGILIHDDIIDRSELRRGMPSMHKKIGEEKAICVGDFGLLSSILLCTYSDFSSNIIQKAVCHQIKVFETTIAGQLKDIELSKKTQVNEADVIEMYHLKTAWYTAIGPLQLGAILAGADKQFISQLYNIGYNIGIAFQIRDDIQGIFGDSAKTQKSDLSDMREGKHTILYSHFMCHASELDKQQVERIYGNKQSAPTDLEIVRKLLKDVGTYDYSMDRCHHFIRCAIMLIDEMKAKDEYKSILKELIDCICY